MTPPARRAGEAGFTVVEIVVLMSLTTTLAIVALGPLRARFVAAMVQVIECVINEECS